MDKKQVQSFLLGLATTLLVLVAFLLGGLTDRLFVLKPVDVITKQMRQSSLLGQGRQGQAESQQPLPQTELGQMIQKGDYSVADVAATASKSVITVSIKKQQRVLSPQDLFGNFGLFGFGMPGKSEVEEVQRDIGTGFVVEGGLIVTNKHVVADSQAEYLVIDKDDKEHKVTDIYRDPSLDLAILQVKDFQAPPLALGNSDKLRVGEPVIAIGTALGQFRHTVTTGVISGLGRGITAQSGLSQAETLEGMIQTDAAINPGNSGGPLINNRGEVIGVSVAMAQAENIGFAIPINVVKAAINNFRQTGKFDRPMLGVRYRLISERAALFNEVPQGAYLVEVLKNSSADKAGLQAGDIITKFDGQKIDEEHDLAKIINNKQVGAKVKVEYWREDKQHTATVTLQSNQN
jgi:S1-C subfamily serine protease